MADGVAGDVVTALLAHVVENTKCTTVNSCFFAIADKRHQGDYPLTRNEIVRGVLIGAFERGGMQMTKDHSPPTDSEGRPKYVTPELKRWGSVADLTRVGRTHAGDDNWPGSAPHPPGCVIPRFC